MKIKAIHINQRMQNKENIKPYVSGQKFQPPYSKTLNSQDSIVSFGCADSQTSDSELNDLRPSKKCYQRILEESLNNSQHSMNSQSSFKMVKDLMKSYQEQIRQLSQHLNESQSQNQQLVEYAQFLISEMNEHKDRAQGVERMFVSRDAKIQELNRQLNITKSESSFKVNELSQQLQFQHDQELRQKEEDLYQMQTMLRSKDDELATLQVSMAELKEMMHLQDQSLIVLKKQKAELLERLQAEKQKSLHNSTITTTTNSETHCKHPEVIASLESKIQMLLLENEKLNSLLNEKLAELDLRREMKNKDDYLLIRKQLTSQYEALLQERQQYSELEKSILQRQIMELREQLRNFGSNIKLEHDKSLQQHKEQIQRQSQIIAAYQDQMNKMDEEFQRNTEFLKRQLQNSENQYQEIYREKCFLEQRLQKNERSQQSSTYYYGNDTIEYEQKRHDETLSRIFEVETEQKRGMSRVLNVQRDITPKKHIFDQSRLVRSRSFIK